MSAQLAPERVARFARALARVLVDQTVAELDNCTTVQHTAMHDGQAANDNETGGQGLSAVTADSKRTAA